MMYSANYFVVMIMQQVCWLLIVGAFRKSAITRYYRRMWRMGVTGTGHNMVLSLPDGQKLCVYHGEPGKQKKTGRVYRSYGDKADETLVVTALLSELKRSKL